MTFAGCIANIMMAGTYYRLTALIIPFFLLMLTKRLYYCDFQTIYTYPGIGKLVAPQMDLEKTLAVDCEYYFGNYNKVMHIVEKEENPNQYMKFYYNLVMAQNHCLSANLLKFPDNNLGTFETLGPNTPTLTIKTLNELYWVLGDMTFCERAAMLANVCSPNNRNIRMIKRLAEVNLVKGDYQATRKYLRRRHSYGKDGPTAFLHPWAFMPCPMRKPSFIPILTSARLSTPRIPFASATTAISS